MPARDPEHLEALGDALHTLLRGKEFTDVKFAVDAEEFAAHRVVLCAASPYFRKLLAGGFQETTADAPAAAIPLEICGPQTFGMVLEFLYCGTVGAIDRQCGCELLRAAD